jgi:DNA-binding NtrC family response regulator
MTREGRIPIIRSDRRERDPLNTDVGSSEQTIVLVVDDDRSTRLALRAALSGMGLTVLEAGRGEEALALVRVTWVDAVLLDVDMPGMGGRGSLPEHPSRRRKASHPNVDRNG